MTPSNDLFNLIKSLTPPEKKVFKMHFSGKPAYTKVSAEKDVFRTKNTLGSVAERERIYMALYNAIDRQKKYNEDVLKKKFQTKLAPGSFHVIKNYLFHLILDTLCSYYPGTLPDFTVQQTIEKAKVLNAKLLTNAAWKLILKAKQAAITNELFPEALQALDIERKIIKD